MANPNIVSVAAIYGNTNYAAIGTGSPDTQILSNAASSGKIYKVNSLYVANIDGSSSADVSVRVYNQAALGGTAIAIASTVAVAADSTLVLVTKDTAIYVLENSSLGCYASASGDLTFSCSWDEINA